MRDHGSVRVTNQNEFNKLLSGNITYLFQKAGIIMISVGIDVSKGKSTVCILKPGGEVIKPSFEIEHTAEELDSLVSLINSFDEETRVVLEDTGHYHICLSLRIYHHTAFLFAVQMPSE